jgi:hypothetical protein
MKLVDMESPLHSGANQLDRYMEDMIFECAPAYLSLDASPFHILSFLLPGCRRRRVKLLNPKHSPLQIIRRKQALTSTRVRCEMQKMIEFQEFLYFL